MTPRRKKWIAVGAALLLVVLGGLGLNMRYTPSVALGTDLSTVVIAPLAEGAEGFTLADYEGSWVVLDVWSST